MYLYYPDLNWQLPPTPDYDNYGKRVNKSKARQTIHHLNGNHFDDTKDNLSWRLISDHIRDEQQNFKKKKFTKDCAKDCAIKLGLKVDN